MNERVKEVIMSKGLHKFVTSECQARMEMLADSIILECIKACPHEDGRNHIRKHFKIDERTIDDHLRSRSTYFGNNP